MNSKTDENILYKAPEFEVNQWIDASGNSIEPIRLSDFKGKFKVVYCFQSWCSGCHSQGFPSLKKMIDALKGTKEVVFLAVQTVFEGHHENTFDKIIETQKQYDLEIPFGHDPGDENTGNRSRIMMSYRTGGTPWFIFIDQHDTIVFGNFHLNADKAIEVLKTIQQIG